MTFKHLRLPKSNGPLPSCINWKWVEVTAQGEFKAYYCIEGKCRDLGIFKSADSANFEVVKAIRAHINQEVGHFVKDWYNFIVNGNQARTSGPISSSDMPSRNLFRRLLTGNMIMELTTKTDPQCCWMQARLNPNATINPNYRCK